MPIWTTLPPESEHPSRESMGYKVRDTEKLSKNSFFTAAEQTVCPNPERLLVLEYRNVVKDKFTPENGKKPQEDDKNSKS